MLSVDVKYHQRRKTMAVAVQLNNADNNEVFMNDKQHSNPGAEEEKEEEEEENHA